MLSDLELEDLLRDMESDRVERKEALSDLSRIRQAICAFANDMPNHRQPGVVFLGVKDDGTDAGLAITDELLLQLAAMRSDGNVLPLPRMEVAKHTLRGSEVAVVLVHPSNAPPVRFNGRTWIRVGPRRATASLEEERHLNEKRRARDLPHDLCPVTSATLEDLDHDRFLREYVTSALAPDVVEANERTTLQQLTSLRFVGVDPPHSPTVTGLLIVGKAPVDYIPGAYVQFLRIDGTHLTDPIVDQKEIHGALPDLLQRLNDVLKANISTATDITSSATELRHANYPIVALQQIVRNSIMHRNYETTNAPVRVTWFSDRVEIQNPGGPFGQVTVENFGTPGITDYRNPTLAEALKTLGFVQRFGAGIPVARKALADNGNPEVEFSVEANHVLATLGERR